MMIPEDSAEAVQKIIGYEFRDDQLLNMALTHRSAEHNNNERLEFLGDSVLGLIITMALYNRYPSYDEGALTRLRARLVRQETLANIARVNRLGALIVLGQGAVRSGAADRNSILADVLESLIGAVYLESGLDAARCVVDRLFVDEWTNLGSDTLDKDPKTQLQERLQKMKWSLPKYSVKRAMGEAHNREFIVECVLEEAGSIFEGQGTSRRKAEQEAAGLALKSLES